MGPNGPQPISLESMHAFTKMTGRTEQIYSDQLLRFVAVLDREYLRDFYDKQHQAMEKQRKESERKARQKASAGRR